MKTKISAVAFACFLFGGVANAQVTLDVTPAFRSGYLYDNGVYYDKHPSMQLDLLLTFPNGIWLDINGLQDTKGRNDYGREIDWGVGWGNDWTDVGLYYEDLTDLFEEGEGGDAARFHIDVFHLIELNDHHGLTPIARYEYVLATEDTRAQSGEYYHLGVIYDWQITERLSVSQDFRFVYDGGAYEADDGWIGRYEGGITYQLTDGVAITPFVLNVTTPVSGDMHDRGTEAVVGAEVTFSFNLTKAEANSAE